MGKKRSQKRSESKNHDNNALDGGSDRSREEVIARLLQSQSDDTPATGQQRPAQPMIQDAAEAPARPKFEMPDMSSSASLLARVQSFLPQLQQANTSLPTDHAGSSGFELIKENSDDEEDEDTSNDIKHTRDSDSDDDDDDSDEQGDDTETHPQIVMNLALGVFEEKKARTEGEASSSSEISSDDEASDSVTARATKERRSTSKEDDLTPEAGHISLSKDSSKSGRTGKKPLIEEMS